MKPQQLSTNQRIARVWALLAGLGLLLWLSQRARGAESEVTVSIEPCFRGGPLVFDQLRCTNAAGQSIAVTRLDMLLSGIAVRRVNGAWLEKHHWFAFISAREGRTNFVLRGLPAGDYDRLRFNIGVPAEENHASPAQWDAAHPLNPQVNGLHWNWQGGYVFLALEGKWVLPPRFADGRYGMGGERVNPLNTGLAASGLSHPSPALPGPETGGPRPAFPTAGFSWHLATDRQLMAVEVPVTLAVGPVPVAVRLDFDLATVFGELTLDHDTSFTHSREGDELADWLREGVVGAFTAGPAGGLQPPLVVRGILTAPPNDVGLRVAGGGVGTPRPTNSVGTPYRFTYAGHFPKPALPLDNPLTEEGVALGRRLFNDPLLSRGEKQSCASCHQMDGGTVDAGRAFSLGVDGREGKRNAMPLYNLAWKSEFFWDGRAKSLRQQALMPIQDELEMHETLPDVLRKLVGRDSVEPSNERSEAGKAGILPTGTNRDARSARADSIGKQGSTESRPTYATLFTRAFGTPDITAERVGLALEQFLLTVTSFDAKFDRVMRGEAKFTPEEQRGFELFHTEHDPRRGQFGADCFHCHGGPLFQNIAFANNGLDREPKDLGRYLVTGREGDKGKFAVPSLRNVELTAPYMHDGRHRTLEEAVLHYIRNVQRSQTLDPNLAKHPPGGIRLPPPDLHALVAFLKTLTDESLRPVARRAALVPSP
ncbi:MAG: MbnP family protein [Limisphaerales bacterium]